MRFDTHWDLTAGFLLRGGKYNPVPNEQMKSSSGFFPALTAVVALTAVWTTVDDEINALHHACVCVFPEEVLHTHHHNCTPILAHGELGI